MSNIINKTDHGINFEYDALDGLSMPTKLITVNNSDYKLINSKDIDWNNSFLSYIPQIQNISDYIKQHYVNDDVKDEGMHKSLFLGLGGVGILVVLVVVMLLRKKK